MFLGCDTQENNTIRLATTTSTESSGLLDVLLPVFQQTGITVEVMPMGTGRALRTARDGNCDLVLVHAPQAEQQFVSQGWGVNRTPVMYNDFVILGPPDDPAGIRGMKSASAGLAKIASVKCLFVSRGDNSGTHQKELQLWEAAELAPAGKWYRSLGSGMGQTLTVAEQLRAYVLADRGTFIKFSHKIDLQIMVQGDRMLHNPYAAIAVNPKRHPHVKYDLAMKFIQFLTSRQGQKLIADYTSDGEPLFHPWPEQPVKASATTGTDNR